MDLTVIALAGVLLLGAGVAILVVNLRKSGSDLVDQIGTYGYVAEATGGSSEAEGATRRPIDSIAGRMGEFAAKRYEFGEDELRQKLVAAGMYETTPRKILGYQVILAAALAVLTAQNRYARWILTALPVALLIMVAMTTPSYIEPLFHTTVGIISLVAWVFMLVAGSFWIKKITTMEV